MVTLNIVLRVGGERTRVEVDEAKTIVKRFETTIRKALSSSCDDDDNNNYDTVVVDTLDISCRAWPLSSLMVLNSFLLKHSKTITILNIQDIIASLLTDEGLQCLEYLANHFKSSTVLTNVDVSHNALGTRGIEVLKPLLQVPTLQRIYLNNCGISAEAGDTLYELLQPNSKQLQLINLSRNQMGINGCIAMQKLLKDCTSLQYLGYAGCRPLKDGTKALCQGIVDMVQTSIVQNGICSLSYLNLDDCEFKVDDDDDDDDNELDNGHPISTLCCALEKCPLIQTLIIRDGNIKSIGLQRLLNAITKSKAQLQYLDVGCNELCIDGATILSKFISTTQTMSLQTIICDTNELETLGLANVTNAFQKCTKLTSINLQCNEITSIVPLATMELSTLQELDLTDNVDLTKSMIRSLQQKYSKVTILYDDDLDDGDDDNDDDDNNDDDVDDLANALSQSQI